MLHLGREPRWIGISGKVQYPEEVKKKYTEMMEKSVKEFEKDFAARLYHRKFSVVNMVVQPRGLTNEKLMCFANSSMQLLFASPYFVTFAHFMKTHLPLFSPKQRQITPGWHAFCQFLNDFQFTDSESSDGALPSLKSLNMTKMTFPTSLKILDPVFGMFKSTRKPLTQEDAIQFLMYWLNVLHEEILALINLAKPEDVDSGGWTAQGTGRGAVKVQETLGEQSPLSDIFSTLIRADTLQNGRSRSVSRESFLVLPLEIRGRETLEDAIHAFTIEEKINATVSKKNSYTTFPKSLIIGLKRFDFDPYTGEMIKLLDVVEYPEVLTLHRAVDGAPIHYQLSAVVEHQGKTPAGGHYICWARRFDGTWMKFNDDKVSTATSEQHLGLQAYLLLYNQITSAMTSEKKGTA